MVNCTMGTGNSNDGACNKVGRHSVGAIADATDLPAEFADSDEDLDPYLVLLQQSAGLD